MSPVKVETPVTLNPPTPVTCDLEATKDAIVPNEVIFGCAAVSRVPLKLVAVRTPVTIAP